MNRERTLHRKRWAMVFYELNLISRAVFNEFMDADYEYDERLSQLMNGARRIFVEKGYSKDWIAYYGHYFQRTFTVPKIAAMVTRGEEYNSPNEYEVELDIEHPKGESVHDMIKRNPHPSVKIVNVHHWVDGHNEFQKLPSIFELEHMRKEGDFEFKEMYGSFNEELK